MPEPTGARNFAIAAPARLLAGRNPPGAGGLLGTMQLAFDGTDWSVLSHLLRCAQRDGWRIRFHPDSVEISSARPAPSGVVVLPAALLRVAREAGWQVGRQAAADRGGGGGGAPAAQASLALRHPSVHQRVRLVLGAGG
jgi:hypothetical protein